MRYYVEVTRISYARQTLATESDSKEQAGQLALQRAPEGEFSTYDTEYEVSSVEPAQR